ncbi:MAG: amino acid decarboxylase [Solirubrobacterales bacterium]|nr:amino acid decarboxylase [Solirubrobacterales bacterium]
MVVPLPLASGGVPDQNQAPYLDALLAYSRRDPGRLHIPGHKGGPGAAPELIEAIGAAALEMDIPVGIEGIDVGPPDPTPFEQAQSLAADAWGAKRSWFLMNGGSGGNHAISMIIAHSDRSMPAGEGPRQAVQRNVHSSIIDGMVLSGARPTFVQPELDPKLGIAHCVTPEALGRALADEPQMAAAIIVSPTYFGAVADVAALAEVAHSHGVPLMVDEAWGAQLYFSESLPSGALRCGADLVLSSTHKIVGSLTQSAILHLGSDELVDPEVVDRSVTLIETTSPSGLLTASLDATRRMAATRGEELLAETLGSLERARAAVKEIPGLDVLDERMTDHPSVHAYDPLRLAVDVRGTGATGHRIAKLMHDRDDINVELFTENMVVAAFGMGERAAPTAERLVAGLRHAVEEVAADDTPRRPFAEPPPWGPLERSPRQAFLGPQEVVSFEEAENRIAAESLAAYPPGVPNVLPGERLTGPTLAYIADSIAHGGHVRGASDRTLRTIRVVRE